MDEVDRVLTRLRRIDALQTADAARTTLLGELRALVGEAEAWARAEGDVRAREAAAELRARTEGMR